MRARVSFSIVLTVLLLGACTGDDRERVSVGDTPPAGDPVASGAAGLALPRCDDLPRLTTEPEVADLADDPEVAAWQQQRAMFGLASDQASTQAAADDAAGVDSMGFPMTAAEETAVFAAEGTSSATAAAVSDRFAAEPAYGGHWIDSVTRDVVVLAIAGDPVAWQAQADAEIEPGRVRVIEVAHSEAELRTALDAAQDRLAELGGSFGGAGLATMQNVASLFLEVLDPDVVAEIAAVVPSGTVCVEGAEPADVVPEGPQPQSGDGWRLLADAPGAGVPYATGFAGDDAALAALWADIGLPGEPPAVAFATEVVVWFGPAVSGSCAEIRLDDVVIDAEAAVLSAVIVLIGGERMCTSDANPHAYVVAVARDLLPERFTVSIGAPNEECCPEGTTEVDLR